MEQREEKYIMGTMIEITIDTSKDVQKDIEEAFDIFSGFESEFSRFLSDSDLTKLNIKKNHTLSDRFIEVIKLTKNIHKTTQGYFNPLLDLSIIGYTQSFEKQIFQKQDKQIDLDLDTVEVEKNRVILQKHQNLDLGGIVKGYCVDEVYNFLFQKGYRDFIVNAGGDIRISGKYTVAIDSPFVLGDIFAILDIENKAISTSGTYKRKWKIRGENYHHILSPEKSSFCGNEIISISLISDTCYISDTYATACIAMGFEKAVSFLRSKEMDGVIITSDGQHYCIGDMKSYNLEII